MIYIEYWMMLTGNNNELKMIYIECWIKMLTGNKTNINFVSIHSIIICINNYVF